MKWTEMGEPEKADQKKGKKVKNTWQYIIWATG